MDSIFIEGLQVQARVGIYPREQVAPQAVEINLTFGVPEAAAGHDDIADTIDYDKVVQRIQAVIAERHFNLLETLAETLANVMLQEFRASWARISIAKMGVLRGVRRVGVCIERRAQQQG